MTWMDKLIDGDVVLYANGHICPRPQRIHDAVFRSRSGGIGSFVWAQAQSEDGLWWLLELVVFV